MTCRVANVLKSDGVRKGDRVAIYMPVSPLLVASMLACARIGAIHRYIVLCNVCGSYSSSERDLHLVVVVCLFVCLLVAVLCLLVSVLNLFVPESLMVNAQQILTTLLYTTY